MGGKARETLFKNESLCILGNKLGVSFSDMAFSVGHVIFMTIKKCKKKVKTRKVSQVEKLKTVQQGHITGLSTPPLYICTYIKSANSPSA